MSSSGSLRTGVALAIGLAIGLAVGAVWTTGDSRPESAPRTALASPEDADRSLAEDDRAALRRLSEELSLLRADLAAFRLREATGATPPPEETRFPVAPAEGPSEALPVETAELRRWMDVIERRLEALAEGGVLSSPTLRMPPIGVRPRPLPVPLATDPDAEAFETSHMAWSAQEVLDVYGRPDVVHGQEEWEYKYRDGNGGELSDVHFQFSGGLVVRIFAH